MEEKKNLQKPASVLREEEILAFWENENVFEKSLKSNSLNGEFIFYEGPPTANGIPGVHHVETRSFKDVIARYKTMQGFHVRRKAGWDTHGLPVELQVEKELGLKSKKEIETFGVAAFNEKCKESVWKYRTMWEDLTKRMGYWLDMKNPYVTYHNAYIESLWQIVKTTNDKGLLYKDYKVLPWCTRCGTALSSHELGQPGAYQDDKDLSVTAKFKINAGQKIGEFVADDATYIIAWTTTPWTLLGNVALAVGEKVAYGLYRLVETNEHIICAHALAKQLLKDKAYQEISFIEGSLLVGLSYEPLYSYFETLAAEKNIDTEKAFKIYNADFVTTTDGTGVVHTAVMYGQDDFELGTKIGLPKLHLVGEDGLYVNGCGEFAGRYVKDEQVAIDIIKDLAHRGLLYSKEKYTHSYPHCWRCDTALIYYARDSWYIKTTAFRDQMLQGNSEINWEPEHIKKGRFGEWLDGIRDWAISRDRYWGTPLPIWHTQDGKEKVVIGSFGDVKKYAKKSGNKYFAIRHGQAENNIEGIHHKDQFHLAPLTEQGKEKVLESAQQFKGKIDIVIRSPYLRTKETAEIFCNQIGFSFDDIIVDDRLKEWNTSPVFTGKAHGEFAQYYHYSYVAEPEKVLPESESFADMVKRVGDFIYDIEQKYQGKNILLVSHSGTMRALEFVRRGSTFEDLAKPENFIPPPENAEVRTVDFVPLPHNAKYELDFHKPYIDEVQLQTEDGRELKRTAEVMDVWFDSGCMPYAQDSDVRGLHESESENWFSDALYPADYITEAIDQTRGWFYTLHAVSNILSYPQPSKAYKNVVCLGHILDKDGQKMSKSKGNVVNPWDMFDKYGADTMRLWMYSVTQPGDSKNFDEKTVKELQNKFFNTLENCLQILKITETAGEESGEIKAESLMDQWILSYFAKTHQTVTTSLDKYDMFTSSRAIREFVTDLSQWYVRRSRDGLKENVQTRAVLRFVLNNFAVMIAPFVPFTAEWLFKETGGEGSVHLVKWNTETMSVDTELLKNMEETRKLVSVALEARQKANIKVRQPLGKLEVGGTTLNSEYSEILKDELNVKEIVFSDKLEKGQVVWDITITSELKAEGNVRELMRAMQDMRKQMGLEQKDRIAVTLQTNDEGKRIVELFKNEITKIVGIIDLQFAENSGTEITIEEIPFVVTIEKK